MGKGRGRETREQAMKLILTSEIEGGNLQVDGMVELSPEGGEILLI